MQCGTMRVYVAIAYLDRHDWAGGTVCSSAVGGFELCLRGFFERDTDGMIAAHVSLYFEDTTKETRRQLTPFLPPNADLNDGFFIDVLADGHHRVSLASDPLSWYRKWDRVRVELYAVAPTTRRRVLDVERVFQRMLGYVKTQPPYDCYQNCNSVCLWPVRCSPTLGICCPCSSGTNCIESVAVSLASGFGASEWDAESALGIKRRVARGARLPSTFRDELIRAGVIEGPPHVLFMARAVSVGVTTPLLPAVLIR